MNLRQRLQVFILLTLILFTFASYHEGTGGTGWLQWLTLVFISVFMFVFDLAFTNDSQFIFDPDAENWRRKTVSSSASQQLYSCSTHCKCCCNNHYTDTRLLISQLFPLLAALYHDTHTGGCTRALNGALHGLDLRFF